MLDAERFDAITKLFEDYGASAAEEIDRAPLFAPWENAPSPLAKVHVTFFKNFAAKSYTTDTLTLFDLEERIQNASAREKGKLPWLKCAVFGNKRSDKNSLRHDPNVLEITGIELDYDCEKITFADAVKAVAAMGISALVYTSPSHSPDAPRWRVVAPTSKPLPPDMRAKFVARVNGFMMAELGVERLAAGESFALSQAYFYGWVMNKPGLDHCAEVISGDFIDMRDDLAQYEARGAKSINTNQSKTSGNSGAGRFDQDRARGFEAILAEMGDGEELRGFNDPLTRAAASYVATYHEFFDEKKLKKLLREAIDKAPKKSTLVRVASIKRYKSDKYLDDIIASAVKKFTSELAVTLEHFVADMETHSYIYLPTRRAWPGISVNARIRPVPLLDADGRPVLDSKKKPKKIAASEWLDKNRPVEAVTWAPGEPTIINDRLVAQGGWFEQPGANVFNLYRPPTIVLGDANEAGPWIDHIRKVYPNDADHIIRWCAYKVQFAQSKVNHALFLGGAPGIGKDSILEGPKRAIGSWNFSEVSPKIIARSAFTGYLQSVVLRISEAHDLGDLDRFAFYEMIKTIIAAPPDVHRVNEKHRPEYYIPNVNGVIITSNYLTNGIYLPVDDRRHYVAWSDCTEGDFETGYFDWLWHWYDHKGGDRHVAAYLSKLDLSDFNPKAPPKKTEAFFSIAHANASPDEIELADVIDRLNAPEAVTIKQMAEMADQLPHLQDLAASITERKSRRAIPHRMAQVGYVPVRNTNDKGGLWKVLGAKQVVYARKELSFQDQIRAVSALIKELDAATKARSKAEAQANEEANAKAEAKARAQAEANAAAQKRTRDQFQINARARAHAQAKRELSDIARRALDLLTRCVNEHGKAAPGSISHQIPFAMRVVKLDEWRMTCERGHLSSAPDKNVQEQAFWRAKDELQTANWIACLDCFVWLARPE